ncbi:SUMO protein smt3 [Orobanche gracilis]
MTGTKRSRSKPAPSKADDEDIKPIIPKPVLNMAGNAHQPTSYIPVPVSIGYTLPACPENTVGISSASYQERKPWTNPTSLLNVAGKAPQSVNLFTPVSSGCVSAAHQERKPWTNPTPVPTTAGIIHEPSLPKPVEEEAPPADPFINLQIYYQEDGNRTSYRAKRNIKLQKLLVQYCIDRSLEMHKLRILFEGRRLMLEKTPQELKMEDGDEIEVMIEAFGGSMMV